MRYADNVKGHPGQNPFSDSQARNFSDDKVSQEFYPISSFWTLFNDQHEILVGTRGCGKTFLLKMMRYSMLKKVDHPNAKAIVEKKEFMALYVPMHLEFVSPFKDLNIDEKKRVHHFQFAFNCSVSEALLTEIESVLEECSDVLERARLNRQLARDIDECWFGEKESDIDSIDELLDKVHRLYYSTDVKGVIDEKVPYVFSKQICSPLLMVKRIVAETLSFNHEPTWLICIDEAEFLDLSLQKCINTVFRSDSNRIALKIATLPYAHATLDTLNNGIVVSDGNDFSYRIVDLPYNGADFCNLTNKLCEHRLKTRFNENSLCHTVEEFLGKEGNDDLIDYYRKEVGIELATKEIIEKNIIESFSDKRKANSENYKNRRKTIYDKFAPIFFVREMYKLSKQGNRKPGWYAGASTVRKLSQGNPRIFIQLMNELFNYATQHSLTPKAQHGVIMNFADNFCKQTEALEKQGPVIYKNLNKIAEALKDRAHDKGLITCGSSFEFDYENCADLDKITTWMKIAIAYSRVIVDEETKKGKLHIDTKYQISNMYSARFWLPIRSDQPLKIPVKSGEEGVINTYKVDLKQKKKKSNIYQGSLFPMEDNKND